MADPDGSSEEALRDAVQEGDDDEPDDGEGGGGDHDALLSPGCFRNSRARSGVAPKAAESSLVVDACRSSRGTTRRL
jgi:hypothetical protein